MPKIDRDEEHAVRELAYRLWEREGKPEGRASAHWKQAEDMRLERRRSFDDGYARDVEAVIDGDPKADFPALLTRDVPGG